MFATTGFHIRATTKSVSSIKSLFDSIRVRGEHGKGERLISLSRQTG